MVNYFKQIKLQKKLQKETFEKLKKAVTSNDLDSFLLGVGYYRLNGYCRAAGAGDYNPYAIMGTVYEYSNKFSNIKELMQQSFESIANLKSSYAMLAIIQLVLVQLEKEAKKEATFTLDNCKIIDIIRENITANKTVYCRKCDFDGYEFPGGIYLDIKKWNKELMEKYGYKIIE